MEETPPSIPVESVVPEPTSLWARLFNVFATPGEVFEEVRSSRPCNANWLVPALIAVVLSWVAGAIVFSQENIKHQLSEISSQAIEKQIEKMKASEAQAEQMRAAAEKFGGIGQKVAAFVIPVFAAFATPFIWGGILWLFGRFVFKRHFTFMKSVEVVGLGGMISVLDGIVRALLIISMGSLFASPSLALLVKDFDPQNTLHGLLGAVNIMTFWILAVRATGLSKLSQTSWGKSAACVFGFWLLYTGFFLGVGFALQAVFNKAA